GVFQSFVEGRRAEELAFDTNAATSSRGLTLRAIPEADNCASALWLLSSAAALLLLRSACCCFAFLAKNIRSARCRTSSANKAIRRRGSGPKRAKRKSRKLHRLRLKLRPTKLVRQRRSYG